MHIDHVRELKATWAAWAAAPTTAARGAAARPSGTEERAPEPAPDAVALGVARRSGGYALAVRYQREDEGVGTLLARLREAVGETELDVRRTGPVRALLPDPAARTRPADGSEAPRVVGGPVVGAAAEPAVDDEVAQLRRRVRPLVAGLSVCHEASTAGTIGALVEVDGTWHVLSNSHVLARSGLARPGEAVLQPGPADGGTAADRVGALARAVPLRPGVANAVDVALARLDEGVEVDLSGAPFTTAALEGDEAVEKTGRTTGLTRGTVSAIEVDDVVVDFGPGVGLLRFDGQVEVQGSGTAFSRGGDSGSLVRLAGGGAGVGLLFAGSEQGGADGTGLTYCNVLDEVLGVLGISLPAGPG